ncbi:hypothetical protein EK904_002820 [Melospiza melodia maxima]|nr:hypothetical protein EK904_002820 [Melospiza melodia maxima]
MYETKCSVLSGEKVEEAEQPSDIEEGGLDLTVSLKPVSFYIGDKKEMLQQCFCVIGEKKLQKMLPDTLKNCSMDEIKRLCMEQLELLSEKKLLKILEGKIGADSDTDEEADGGDKTGETICVNPVRDYTIVAHDNMKCMLYIKQDNSIDSTSSLREDSKLEGQESKQGKGEDSDVLSINADAYDSDIEGPCNEEDGPDVQESTVRSGAGQIDDLQKDIEKSVNEILGLAESSPKEPKAAALAVPPSEDVQPSAQQLELLELEMRARAIKALMKAGDATSRNHTTCLTSWLLIKVTAEVLFYYSSTKICYEIMLRYMSALQNTNFGKKSSVSEQSDHMSTFHTSEAARHLFCGAYEYFVGMHGLWQPSSPHHSDSIWPLTYACFLSGPNFEGDFPAGPVMRFSAGSSSQQKLPVLCWVNPNPFSSYLDSSAAAYGDSHEGNRDRNAQKGPYFHLKQQKGKLTDIPEAAKGKQRESKTMLHMQRPCWLFSAAMFLLCARLLLPEMQE